MKGSSSIAFLTCIVATAAGAAWSAHLVGVDRDQCPQPSAASVAALFAPCQALEGAMNYPIPSRERELPPKGEWPLEAPAPQVAANEHATVGVVGSKIAH